MDTNVTATSFVWDGATDSDGKPCNYRNVYECDACGDPEDDDCQTWEDYWSCACDDDCPRCGATISPSQSTITDLVTGERETQNW